MSAEMSAAVERYLHSTLIQQVAPLVLTFTREWQLRAHSGDPSQYALNVDAAVEIVRDLFLGIDTEQAQQFPTVELPGGRFANIHLVPDGAQFHVALLGASTEMARQREVQQVGHEAALAGHEKSRALRKLKKTRGDLELQRARLEEANALKNALLGTVSHEFRTPLSTIFGHLDLLERRLPPDSPDMLAVRAIRRGSTHLFALAENLLEYGRGENEAGLLNPRRVDLQKLAEEMRNIFLPLAEEQGLELYVNVELGSSAPAVFDELKLKQILINLLSNALRYTRVGSVNLKLAWDGKHLVLEVKDTGVGIAPEFREAVFRPFNRGAQAGAKGAGLGLASVQRLVGQMQGRLVLETVVGGGSCFTLVLPPAPDALDEAKPEDAGAQPWPRDARALVAADDAEMRGLLALLLRDLGFSIAQARDANETFERTIATSPDLVVLDADMPGLSGNAAVYKLRAQRYAGRIVTLSDKGTTEARDAAIAAGSDCFLTKPLDLERFARVVRHDLTRRKR